MKSIFVSTAYNFILVGLYPFVDFGSEAMGNSSGLEKEDVSDRDLYSCKPVFSQLWKAAAAH